MKSLTEHNQEQMQRYGVLKKMQEPHANGIACPNCDEELWDSNPMEILTSMPPQKNVHCPNCGYRGYRVA